MTATQIDICVTVSILSWALSNPIEEHMTALNWVWKYLAGTLDLALFYSSTSNLPGLYGYCDADWVGLHLEMACSMSGYVFTLAGGLISWSSKKQTTVALSLTELEYIAMSLATQEALWIQLLLHELNINQNLAMPILILCPVQI